MLGWLRKITGLASPSIEDAYFYSDGTKKVRGDPMGILRKLSSDPDFDFDRERMLTAVEGKVGIEAMGKLVEGVRRAFDLPPVKDGGLTEPKVMQLLLDFMQWLEAVKKNMPVLPPAVQLMPDTQAEDSPEAKNSDLTSTPDGQPQEHPSPSSLPSMP